MIDVGDVVKLKPGNKIYPGLKRTATYVVRHVKGTAIRLAGQDTYMSAASFEKVENNG